MDAPPPRTAREQCLPDDVLLMVLKALKPAAVATCMQVSKSLRALATPILYSQLTLTLEAPRLFADGNTPLPAPFNQGVQPTCTDTNQARDEGLRGARPSNTNLHYCRHLTIPAHHWRACSSSVIHSGFSPARHLPRLESLTYLVDARTYHWPATCPLVCKSTPRTIRMQVSDQCNALQWLFGSRAYERLPSSVERIEVVWDAAIYLKGTISLPHGGAARAGRTVKHPENIRDIVLKLTRGDVGCCARGTEGDVRVEGGADKGSLDGAWVALFAAQLNPLISTEGPTIRVAWYGKEVVCSPDWDAGEIASAVDQLRAM